MEKSKTNVKNTIVVNFCGGPGAGKSTMAADLFCKLKWSGVDCELITEYAKDLVWEKREKTLDNQIYIFGKQHHKMFRLLGQVNVIITDSPLFLTPLYDLEQRETLKTLVLEESRKFINFNLFIKRKKKYNTNGRLQTKMEAKQIDGKIKKFLVENYIEFLEVDGDINGICHVEKKLKNLLKN